MKHTLALFLLAAIARASSPEIAPVPVKAVHPTRIPLQYEGSEVALAMTIDKDGVPHDVRAAGWIPSDLAARVIPAVRQWRFSPAYVNHKPAAVSVVLPLKLVDGDLAQAPTPISAELVARR